MPHHGAGDYRCAAKAACNNIYGVKPGEAGTSAERLWVAVQQGVTSGGEACIMRYTNEDLIEKNEGGQIKYYWYYRAGEKQAGPRTKFCTSDKGTGVNAGAYRPGGSKAGDATKGCGDNLGYIRISDRYTTRDKELRDNGCL
jgi:hypothetical protein